MAKILKQLAFHLTRFISTRNLIKLTQIKFLRAKHFNFNKEELEYFYHSYNNHRLTDRAIEIPIIKHYWDNYQPSRILEIGNVTNHYYSYFAELYTERIVVDRYEKAYGVINQDILTYNSPIRYPFIFSISTFEHLDSDRGRNPDYIKGGSVLSSYVADAIVHVCTNLLSNGGIFILTAPLGYAVEFDHTMLRPELYKNLSAYKIHSYYFKKVSEIEWLQVPIYEVWNPKRHTPVDDVPYLVILEIKHIQNKEEMKLSQK